MGQSHGTQKAEHEQASVSAHEHNAASPLYALPPDIIASIYLKLDKDSNRRSFSSSCKAVHECEHVRSQAFKTVRLFDPAHISRLFHPRPLLEPLLNHPDACPEVLEWNQPGWAAFCDRCNGEQKAASRLLWDELHAAPAAVQKLSTVQHLRIVAPHPNEKSISTFATQPPWPIIAKLLPNGVTVECAGMKLSSSDPMIWFQDLLKVLPTNRSFQAKAVRCDEPPSLSPPSHDRVGISFKPLVVENATPCARFEALGIANCVHGLAVVHKWPSSYPLYLSDLCTFVRAFPAVRSLEISKLHLDQELPTLIRGLPAFSALRFAVESWTDLQAITVSLGGSSFYTSPAVARWFEGACAELQRVSMLEEVSARGVTLDFTFRVHNLDRPPLKQELYDPYFSVLEASCKSSIAHAAQGRTQKVDFCILKIA